MLKRIKSWFNWFLEPIEPSHEGKLTFCETSTAYYWHLRYLSEKGPKYGGGADTETLCGIKPSWDVSAPVEHARQIKGVCSICLNNSHL